MSISDIQRKYIPIINVDGSCVNFLSKKSCIKTLGQKALGLSSLPIEWTKPFIVLSSKILLKYSLLKSEKKEEFIHSYENAIKVCLVALSVKDNAKIIVRSSYISEDIENRGMYYSVIGQYSNICDTIIDCFEKHIEDPYLTDYNISFIIQVYVQDWIVKGHFSNERRCSSDKFHWLCTYKYADSKTEHIRTFHFPEERIEVIKSSDYLGLKLASIDELMDVLYHPARWCLLKNLRIHFEWVWDGSDFFIVQADEEKTDDRKGYNPYDLIKNYQNLTDYIPMTLEELSDDNFRFTKYRKLENVLLYKRLNIFKQRLYVLSNKNTINSIYKGFIPDSLILDLEKLLTNELIIRTDVNIDNKTARQMLPRTEGQHDLKCVKSWLVSTTRQCIDEYGFHDFIFIFHNFIPSVSSAFSYVEPNNPLVRVESLWGLPEGLYYNSHDKFEVITSPIKNQNRDLFEAFVKSKKINYKGFFISADENGEWTRKATKIPFDYQPSIDDVSLKEVAIKSRIICEYVQKPISIMWFISVPDCVGPSNIIPWFHEEYHYVANFIDDNLRTRTYFDKTFTIKTRNDIDKIRSSEQKQKSLKFIRIQPTEDSLLRDKAELFRIAKLCNDLNAVLILEGGMLSHAYYQLKKLNVNIYVLNNFEV